MKYLVSAAIAMVLAGCNSESNAAPATAEASAAQDVPQIVGNTGQPAGAMPPGNPMLGQLGEMGGAAEAAVEMCGGNDDVNAAKQQQRAQFLQMGGTAEQFDAAYKAGYDRAKSEFQAAGTAERQRMCASMQEMNSRRIGDAW